MSDTHGREFVEVQPTWWEVPGHLELDRGEFKGRGERELHWGTWFAQDDTAVLYTWVSFSGYLFASRGGKPKCEWQTAWLLETLICLQQLVDFWGGISVTGRKERRWKEANKNAKEHQNNVFPAICFGLSASSLFRDLWAYSTRGSLVDLPVRSWAPPKPQAAKPTAPGSFCAPECSLEN